MKPFTWHVVCFTTGVAYGLAASGFTFGQWLAGLAALVVLGMALTPVIVRAEA